MSGTTFEFEHVSRAFGAHLALSDVSLRIEPGRHTAVLGPSGCGKTTLLRLLAGLDAPSAGRITMNGKPASEPGRIFIPPHHRDLAMVFQDLALWPNLRVIDNVVLALSGAKLSRREVRSRAEESLARCAIADLSTRRPGELSGGQQQRVALARAIASRPGVLLLDEPFTALDVLTKAQILEQITGLARDVGFTILMVTHDPADAHSVCDAMIIMDNGRVTDKGPFDTLLERSDSRLLQRLRDMSSEKGRISRRDRGLR